MFSIVLDKWQCVCYYQNKDKGGIGKTKEVTRWKKRDYLAWVWLPRGVRLWWGNNENDFLEGKILVTEVLAIMSHDENYRKVQVSIVRKPNETPCGDEMTSYNREFGVNASRESGYT